MTLLCGWYSDKKVGMTDNRAYNLSDDLGIQNERMVPIVIALIPTILSAGQSEMHSRRT
jgi:hypothetical protein